MLHKFLLAGLLISLFSYCANSSDQVRSDDQLHPQVSGAYGDPLSGLPPVSLAHMVQEIQHEGVFEGKVYGTIKEVCAHKGCWMTVELPDGSDMRVTFKDYGFFVPKNAQGFRVTLEGMAEKSVTDVATLKHYAEDAGKAQTEIDSITEPEESVAFEAVGVEIEEGA
ncbi:MAG: DUF4920 domain-containing protein [Lunatimonas sp.]|uniref:DUF4920 domain-containing protein n=1 Tax=Lunatimonas sp. TaxID=2060141 RepID=UPI00263AAF76|nr:DUF4920 domain-containing protein [Lunatimonas sp.]MCC5938786.1 DUF4920 domain-containing protein [Lunatimonas sp.]